MSVVGNQSFQSKPLRAVAKKSTTKPARLWTNGKPLPKKDQEKTKMETNSVTNTADSTVSQDTSTELKCLNGNCSEMVENDISGNGNGDSLSDESVDKVTTSVPNITSADSSDLQDSKGANSVTTDEEDMLLQLSDTESLTPQAPEEDEEAKSVDSPLVIGVKVRNSVKELMSKLVQDCSSEVNKILSKPKNDDGSKDCPTRSPKTVLDVKSDANKSGGSKPAKENLFEIMSAETKVDDTLTSTDTKVQMKIVSGENSGESEDCLPSDILAGLPPSPSPTTQADQTVLSSHSQHKHSDDSQPDIDIGDSCLLGDNDSQSSTKIGPQTSAPIDMDIDNQCSENTDNIHKSISQNDRMTLTHNSYTENPYPAKIKTEIGSSDILNPEFPQPLTVTDGVGTNMSVHIKDEAESSGGTSVSVVVKEEDSCDIGNISSATLASTFKTVKDTEASSNITLNKNNDIPLAPDTVYSVVGIKQEIVKTEGIKQEVVNNEGVNQGMGVVNMEGIKDGCVKQEGVKIEGVKQECISYFDAKSDNITNIECIKIDPDEMGKRLLIHDSTPGVSEGVEGGVKSCANLKVKTEGLVDIKSEKNDIQMKDQDTKDIKPDIKDESKETAQNTSLKKECDSKVDIKTEAKVKVESQFNVNNAKSNLTLNESDICENKSDSKSAELKENLDTEDKNCNNNSADEKEENTEKEKKRSIDSSTVDDACPAKRSRLDIMIGKLGDQIGIAPESVQDAVSCESDSEEESRQESDDISESKSDYDDARSDDNTADETTSKITEDDADTSSMQEEVCSETVDSKSDKEVDTETKKQPASEETSIVSKDEDTTKDAVTKSDTDSASDVEMTDLDNKDDDDVNIIDCEAAGKESLKSDVQEIKADTEGSDLDKLVRKKVLELIKSYRDDTIESLENRIASLTEANERWKNTAKDLQKQVLDLTIVQHRLDKRKAATAALKIITSRTIGCQVDSTRLPPLNGFDAQKSPPKTILSPNQQYTFTSVQGAASSTPTMVSMINKPPSGVIGNVQVNNMSQLLSATAVSKNTLNNSSTTLSPSIRQSLTPVTSVRNLLETSGKNAKVFSGTQRNNVVAGASRTVTSTSLGNSVKVIDLTADDDNGKKSNTSAQGKAQLTVVPVSSFQQPIGSSQIVRPLGSTTNLPPGASILLSGPSGTQLVSQSALGRLGGNLQLVTVSAGNNTIRPGSLLTVMPSTGSTYPQTVTINTSVTTPTMTSKAVTLDTSNIIVKTVSQPIPSTQPPRAPTVKSMINSAKHPAPLPQQPVNKTNIGGVKGLVPPKPDLKISRVSQGIVLSWTITQNLSLYSEIASYQLFAYQEGSSPPSSSLWKKVGDVKALPLPMACTLTQFQEGNKYHFAVRALDIYNRISEFSEPSSIHLFPKSS